jgi:competence protein ComEC
LGRAIAWLSFLFLTWTIRVVEWTAGFPGASVSFGLSAPGLVGVYGLLLGATYVSTLPAEQRQSLLARFKVQLPLKAALAGLALLTALTWAAVRQFPDGKLHVVFMDVGQGDSIYVESPSGVQVLIDGGPDGSVTLSELGRQIPFWDRSLDFVVLTHPDQDHVGGLIPVLERYQVRAVVARDLPLENDLYLAWQERLADEGALRVTGEAATHIDLGDGVVLQVLHPGPNLVENSQSDVNNNSVVIRLTYGDVSFLLTGDIEQDVEKELVRSGLYLHSTVLKLPHHGSKTSSSQLFLDAVTPQVAVICVGQDNKFKHPSTEVLERLAETPIYRTDEQGAVSITSDGHRLWIDTER